MTQEEWLKRCAAEFVRSGGLDQEQAMEFAQTCFDAQDGEFDTLAGCSPEDAAGEEMSYWME